MMSWPYRLYMVKVITKWKWSCATSGGAYPRTTTRSLCSPRTPRDDILCKDPKVDALFNSADGPNICL
ncbi:hypothetical protein DOY81_009515 [Sarcophaga bullata]|nr:hypothetical protein DOY81_009515 [Sarcophaga bullata]